MRFPGHALWVVSALLLAAPAAPGADAADPVYLFSTFQEPEQDGLRFAYSFDGYHWTNIPGLFLRANVGGKIMRDPSLLRGPDGMFHLVWTTAWRGDLGFGHASSADLVHWSAQQFVPVMAHEPDTVNVWAPELFYDDGSWRSGQSNETHSAIGNRQSAIGNDHGCYVMVWASTIPGRYPDHLERPDNNHRMYCTTTRDFKSFTPAQVFYEPGFSVIDCQIVRDAGRFVLVLKDNTRPQLNLRVAFGETPFGPWRDLSEPFTKQFTEGPSALRVGDDWLVYYDRYRDKQDGAVKTRDFKSFTNVTEELVFPPGLKHGTALTVSRRDLDRLLRYSAQTVSSNRLPLVSKLTETETAARLKAIDAVAARGPFQPDWTSLQRFQVPEWYQDAKFGIFIHWGAYAVPAFGSEWYPRNLYRTNSPEHRHHLATYGPPAQFGYQDFLERFKAERFDARAWAKLFQEAGAKYVVPVAEHHDGFPMYDSDVTDWCAARRGPRRDVLGELARAFRREGLVAGASSHRAEHWWFFDPGLLIESDVRDERFAGLYGPAASQRLAENQSAPPDAAFLDDWLIRSCEIVDKYRPQVMYFDWWICQPVFQPYLQRFAAYYYNRGAEWRKGVAINFKRWEGESFPEHTGVFDLERGQTDEIRPEFWQVCSSVSRSSWGHVAPQDYKSADEIIDDLADIVSKNGALLLNIGPQADGTIPEPEQRLLREVGAWLRINGEAIYGTRPWRVFGEGPTRIVAASFTDARRPAFTAEDIRFTTKGKSLYALALAWPEDRKLVIKSLAGQHPKRVQLLGHRGRLSWQPAAYGLVVTLPEQAPCAAAVALKITGLSR